MDGFKTLGLYEDWTRYILEGKNRNLPVLTWWNFLPYDFHSSDLGIVFVPSSRDKNWLEQGLPPELNLRTLPALERNPQKLSQKILNRKEREKNGVNLFRIRDDCGKKFSSILLVDDVLSTGTSVRTCVKLLRSMGYEKIFGFVIAYQARDRE